MTAAARRFFYSCLISSSARMNAYTLRKSSMLSCSRVCNIFSINIFCCSIRIALFSFAPEDLLSLLRTPVFCVNSSSFGYINNSFGRNSSIGTLPLSCPCNLTKTSPRGYNQVKEVAFASNRTRKAGNTHAQQSINTAVSRARKCLILVCDTEFWLHQPTQFLAALLRVAQPFIPSALPSSS